MHESVFRPLLRRGIIGDLAEGTLSIRHDSPREEIFEELAGFYYEYISLFPGSAPELSITANFILEANGDRPQYSIWYGGDFR